MQGTAIGLGLASARVAPRWSLPGSLLDADFAGNRFMFGGRNFPSRAAFLVAIGGSEAGGAITIAPKLLGSELVSNPGLDANATGYENTPGAPYNTPGIQALSWDAGGGNGRLKMVRSDSGDGNNQVRFGIRVLASAAASRAFRVGGRFGQAHGTFAGAFAARTGNMSGGGKNNQGPAFSAGQLATFYCAALGPELWLGTNTSSAIKPVTEYFDDYTVQEVVPLIGHNPLALSGRIAATTPAAASGDKVLFQADADDENARIRVVWDANKHLRLIVTTYHAASVNTGTEAANLDLGVVEVGTAFEMRFSSTLASFKANLNGGAIVGDSSGAHPGLAFLRIGRSFTGEAWDGSISRVTLFPAAMSDVDMVDPLLAFHVFGDSTANGDGNGSPTWLTQLATAYTPDRTIAEIAQGGDTTAQLLVKAEADTDHRRWTTVFMDLPNTGETFETWMANIKAAVATRTTSRWYVHPPAQNSPGGTPLNGAAVVTAIQAALLADPFFAGHTLDAVAQAAYLAAVNDDATRSDFTHFNAIGAAIQASTIKAFMDSRGW